MLNGRKTYDDYFKDRDKKNGNTQNKPDPTSTMFRRNTSGVLATNTDYGNSVYDENLNWGADIDPNDIKGSLNEFRANEQSGLDHLGIGLVRTATKAAVEVAKLPGVIGGIAMSPFAEENEGFETAFNNQWIKFFDGLDESVKETLPVYTKEAVRNGDFFDKISSSSFWAEDGADGAGFMLGMLAPGAIFKFAGGANALFGTSIKAAKLAKYGEGIEAGRKALMEAGITINKIDQYMIPAFNTISEAGAEVKGVSDDIESRKGEFVAKYTNSPQYRQDILNKYKELDIQRRNGEISIEDYNKLSANVENDIIESRFKEQKALAMQNTFIKNVAILAVPNYIQSKMLFGKIPSKILLDKIGGIAEKSVKNTAKQVGKRVGQAFLSEGSEEVGQTSVQNRNVNSALNNQLGGNRIDDYSPVTFGEDFVKTLGTTEGQIAGFLGGIMGSPISVISGYKQDLADRKQTERLRDKINGESTAYKDVVGTNIYEQEEYTNPETGEVSTRDKEVNGKKVFIPEAVAKVKNALDLNEKQGKAYDKAIEEGDTETIEYLKGQAEFNLISKFIGEDEVTLDALHEYLKVAFPTQKSENVSEEQVKSNKENSQRVEKIMNKAKSLQKDLMSYKDMAASLIRINNPEVTEEHLADFMNRVGSTFISERAEEFDAKDKLAKLEKQKADLLSNSTFIETDNPNYIEGKTEDIFKTVKIRTNNPRLDLVNKQIEKVKEQLKDFEEATNSTIWDNEYLNNKISNEVKTKNKLQKETSPEQVAKNDEVINKVNNAITVEDVENIERDDSEKTSTQKEDELTILNNIKKRISEDSSLDNLQKILEIVKNSNFSNYDINKVIESIENSIKKIIDERSQFEEIVFEIAEKYANKNKELSDKLTDVDNRINKLLDSKQTLKKSLPNTTKKSKNRILNKLIRETQSEIKRVDSEIKKLESEKAKLVENLESINKNLDYLYTRLDQVSKVGFTSIDDIINYLEKNKERFGEHRFDISRLSTQQFYTEQNIEGIENVIDSLKDYKSVLEQTIKDYLAADEEHSQDLYYLQRELEDTIDSLNESKKELNKEKDKLLRLNKSLNDKLSKQSLNKEIEFWNKLQKYKETKKPNPIIQQKIEAKKAEIIETEKVANAEEIATATQEDNDFNDTTGYSDLNSTEGSNITDELIPQEAENNTVDELKSIENEEVDAGEGAKVISTNRNTGELFSFVSEKYLEYERSPIDKKGKNVGFEINTNPGPNPKVNEALQAFNRGDFSNPKLLIDFLPINVQFTDKIKAPIETRRSQGKLDSKKDLDGKDQFYINPATESLRQNIINHLINGGSINDIKTTIQYQYKGILKVDENRFANNNVLQLNGVKDIKYLRDNLYVVDSFGNLMNIQSGKTKTFSNSKLKPNAAGEIYLMIPQANGSEFPLKLNIKKISESEAVLLYEIYKEIITNEKSLDTTVSEVNDDLREAILKGFEAELNIIGGNKNDIKLQEIVDLLIYQSDNIKSRMQIENGVLYYGENEADINNIEESQNAIINYLVDSKRHQIKINPKFATDNTKTNLKSNSADYLKYLIDNNILSTNAVVNEPTFQGYTNIYLNTGITIINQSQSIQNSIKSDIEVKVGIINENRDKDLNYFRTADDEDSVSFNKYFLERLNVKNAYEDLDMNMIDAFYDAKIDALNQPKVSEAGVQISSNNFEGLDFGNKQPTSQPVTGLVITYTSTGKQTQTYTIDKTKIFNSKGVEVFKEDSADRRKIFANVAVKEGRAKVIEDNKGVKYVVNNKQQIMSTATGKIMEWDENHATRKLLLDKYNGSTQPKVSESGVEVKTDNTGFDSLFENNQPEIRNSQENFVSLSEIPGTVENTEIKETQSEVFETKKVNTVTEQRLINKSVELYKEGKEMTDKQLARLEEWKKSNPEEFKKICR